MKRDVTLSLLCAIAINLSAATLDTIVVESSTIDDLGTDLATEVSTVNSIDRATYEEINPKNINEVLQTIPGITADVRSDVVEIHMRGVAQQEFMWEDTGVAIVVDGVPVLQNGGKVSININDIESIKVIKGGASYLYGNNALAGAIIISTKKHTNKNEATLLVERGSYGYENYRVKASKSTENFALDMHSSYTYEDGYWDQTNYWQKNVGGIATYYIDDMSDIAISADVTRKYQQTTRGSVTGVTAAQTNPTGADDGVLAWSRDFYTDLDKYFVTYNKDFGNIGSLKTNIYYYKDKYTYDSSPQDLNSDGADDTYTRANDETIEQYGFKSEFRGNKNNLAYMVGLSLRERSLKDDALTTADYTATSWSGTIDYYAGEDTYDEGTESTVGIYSELKYKLTEKLTTVGNIRYDHDDYTSSTYTKDYNGTAWNETTQDDSQIFTNYSYRIGATYTLPKKQTLFANISTGFRNPTVTQYAANNNLKTETTITYEVGLRGKLHYGISYEASLFRTDTKDIIGRRDGTYYFDTRVYDNVGDARNQGFELSAKSNRKKKLSFSLAYTYLDAYYTKHNPFIVSLENSDPVYNIVGNQLPRVPKHKIDFIAYYKAMKNLELMAEAYGQSRYYADETNFVQMPGYGLLNLKATYTHKKDMEFFFQIKNALDKQYYRTVYLFSDKNGDDVLDAKDASITVDPGRVMYAGLKYRF